MNGVVETQGEPVPTHTPSAIGPVDEVEATILVAALQGVDECERVASTLPPRAVLDVFLATLPDEWRQRAVPVLSKLSDAEGAMVLAWLCRQWWEAYGLGHTHAAVGEDLRRIGSAATA